MMERRRRWAMIADLGEGDKKGGVGMSVVVILNKCTAFIDQGRTEGRRGGRRGGVVRLNQGMGKWRSKAAPPPEKGPVSSV